jgi:uncharacterized repeat protein (TIGR04052 family)
MLDIVTNSTKLITHLSLLGALLTLACEDDFKRPGANAATAGSEARPPKDMVDLNGLDDVNIQFQLLAGGAPFDCSSAAVSLGDPGYAVQLADGRFFVSEVRLIDGSGTEHKVVLKPDDTYQQAAVALLDFEDGSGQCQYGDAATNTVLHGAVQPGNYRGIAFNVGVPEALNHADPLQAWPPLNVLPMHWGWTEGYRFLRLEVAAPDDLPVSIHFGSGGCSAKSGSVTCKTANRPGVVLDEFDAAHDAVALDLSALLAGSNLQQDNPDCVIGADEDACGPIEQRLGLDPMTGIATPADQTAFHGGPHK